MGLLARFFSRGRLRRAPGDQLAGRVLPPASVQRTQLGISHVDLPAGVVRLRSGEVRVILALTGIPLHHRSAETAYAFLQAWAAALNSLPPSVVCLVRGRPGGLGGVHGALGRVRAQATALATRDPESGLAKLAASQVALLEQLRDVGGTRQTDQYLCLRSPKGDVRRCLEVAAAAVARLHDAGIVAKPVTHRALAQAIAESWHPAEVEHWWLATDAGNLVYDQGVPTPAKVTQPKPWTAPPPPRPALAASAGAVRRQVTAPARKALPR